MTATLTGIAAPCPGEKLRRDIADALDKLAALGSPDQIAEHLQHELIRGVCGDPGQCAVAAYIDHVVPTARRAVLYVDGDCWAAYVPGSGDHSDREAIPDVVGRFVRRFDAGAYPGLQTANSPRCAPVPF